MHILAVIEDNKDLFSWKVRSKSLNDFCPACVKKHVKKSGSSSNCISNSMDFWYHLQQTSSEEMLGDKAMG